MKRDAINRATLFIFIFLALGIFNIDVIHGRKFRELSNKNSVRLIPQEGSRGRILDRHGNIIVDNYLSYNVMMLPQETGNIDKALMKAAKILGVNSTDLRAAFKDEYKSSFVPVTIAKNIDVKKAIALEESKEELGNIMIHPYPLRSYPYGRLACHLLGYLDEIDRWRLTKLADYGYKTKDIVGFGGVEEKYDYYLRQEEGGLSMQVDHRGRLVNVLGLKRPSNGKDIQLTLDLKIQKIAEEGLGERKGSIIIMDPYSGEIIAMANNPGFDPAAFLKKPSSSVLRLLDNPDAPLINRAISGVYPAGSVFKLVVAASALETGKINPSTTFFCPGNTHIGKQEFSCWDTHHQQNLSAAIANSCNVFFYKTGLLAGPQTIYDYAAKFGFSKSASVGLPYEAKGFVPSPILKKVYRFQGWFDGDTANLSIGQGDLLVTPLQVARMMTVFANKRNLAAPYVVKAIDGRDVSGLKKKSAALSLKESTINYIREALRKVVSEPGGTANVLSSLNVSVAGKTGTAQVSSGQAHGWFVGFFPFNKPKFVICVFLEHGGSGHASSVVAKQIIENMIIQELIR